MQPLIDADILNYEVAFAGQYVDEEGVEHIHSFDYVKDIADEKIRVICDAVWANEDPILYMTGKTNFRNDVAVTKPYKGNRKDKPKPFHFKNIRAYLCAAYNTVIVEGLEADDVICMEQARRANARDTIICTRDKDLRICPGMHFGWEVGNQPQFGPKLVDKIGWLTPTYKTKLNAKEEEVEYLHALHGAGLKFFYAQLIMGDTTDNIPGLPRGGKPLAFKLVDPCETEEEMCLAVAGAYEDKFGDGWQTHMLEQGQLLWMIQETNEDGSPKMWEIPYGR